MHVGIAVILLTIFSVYPLVFPSPLPFWRGLETNDCGLMPQCLKLQSFSSFIHLCLICLFFLSSILLPSLPKVWEPCWEDERLTTSSITNSLRARHTLPFSLPLGWSLTLAILDDGGRKWLTCGVHYAIAIWFAMHCQTPLKHFPSACNNRMAQLVAQ